MHIDVALRLSGYLTLAMACLCLGYAEMPFLPSALYLLGAMLVLLAMAWVVDSRGWILPGWAANCANGLILLGSGLGLAYCYRPPAVPRCGWEPMPRAMLLYVGPVLMLLALIKLFRSRLVRDRWMLQGIGLLQVGVACTLADSLTFGLMLLTYGMCGVWHLAIFFQYRGHQEVNLNAESTQRPSIPWRSYGLWRAAGWTLATIALALPLFLSLPRKGMTAWNSFLMFNGRSAPQRSRTAFAPEIDLNRTGPVAIDDRVVLTVEATRDSDGKIPLELTGLRRWRGIVLDHYKNGRWVVGNPPLEPTLYPKRKLPASREVSSSPEQDLPDLGPEKYFLTFSVWPFQAGGLFLAEPIILDPYKPLPVVQLGSVPQRHALFHEIYGTLLPGRFSSHRSCHYRQVTAPLPEPGLSSPIILPDNYVHYLCWQPLPALCTWTKELLHRLAAQPRYQLERQDVELIWGPWGLACVRSPEKTARALNSYLHNSGEYTYTLDRRQEDPTLDPTMDFLCNVKQGHCERYAAALTLMLRSQGIPARIVKGFSGVDRQEIGVYKIRNSFAHSWVEALITRPGSNGRQELHWLTLDPTPGAYAQSTPAPSLVRWWADRQQDSQVLWDSFVVAYNNEQQDFVQETAEATLQGWLEAATHLLAPVLKTTFWASYGMYLLILPFGWGVIRWWLRKRSRRICEPMDLISPQMPLYARLVTILSRRLRLRLAPTQTPHELAEAACRILQRGPETRALADVPIQVTEQVYRVCYGGRLLDPKEEHRLTNELEHFDVVIARHRR